jgi:hypothetical protein
MNIGTPVFVYRLKPEAESHFVKPINAVQPEAGFVTFLNFDGSINVGGFAADGSAFALQGLKVAGSLNPPTLPYYSLSAPAAAKPVVTGGGPVAQPRSATPASTQHGFQDTQSTNKAVGALPVVTR